MVLNALRPPLSAMQERQSAMQQVLTVREDFMQALETGKVSALCVLQGPRRFERHCTVDGRLHH